MTDRFRKIKVLGSGGFGKVYEAVDLHSGETIALKEMFSKTDDWEQCCNMTEVKALQSLNHANIVNLKEVILQDQKLFLVYELLDRDLYRLIDEKRSQRQLIEEDKIKLYIYQLLKGVSYIHKKGYIHRDLKPENLMLTEQDFLLKITDFGIIKDLTQPGANQAPFTEYVSTRWYRAPEIVLKSTKYDTKIDIFAIGCIMAELYLRMPIFPGNSALDQLHKLCSILGTPLREEWEEGYKLAELRGIQIPLGQPKRDLKSMMKTASEDAIDLLEKLFLYNPDMRPSCE